MVLTLQLHLRGGRTVLEWAAMPTTHGHSVCTDIDSDSHGASRAAEALLCLWLRARHASNPRLFFTTPHSYSSRLLLSTAKWQPLITLKMKITAGDAGHGEVMTMTRTTWM